MYHRIAEPSSPADTMCVSPENFAAQMAHLRAAWTPTSAAGLVRPVATRTRRMVAVTFDDGYLDNYVVAKPILDDLEVPATFFVVTAAIGSGTEFWWDELDLLLEVPGGSPSAVRLTDGSEHPLHDSGAVSVARRAIGERLARMTWGERDDELTSIAGQLERTRPRRPDRVPMSWDQVTALATGGLHHIGNHTRNHRLLPLLDPCEQRSEVVGAQDDLAARVGRPAALFAYPGGGVGAGARGVVADVGFDAAFGTEFGVVDRTNVAAVGRFMVRDLPADEFGARLRRWA